jgi:hypothetical protein
MDWTKLVLYGVCGFCGLEGILLIIIWIIAFKAIRREKLENIMRELIK